MSVEMSREKKRGLDATLIAPGWNANTTAPPTTTTHPPVLTLSCNMCVVLLQLSSSRVGGGQTRQGREGSRA